VKLADLAQGLGEEQPKPSVGRLGQLATILAVAGATVIAVAIANGGPWPTEPTNAKGVAQVQAEKPETSKARAEERARYSEPIRELMDYAVLLRGEGSRRGVFVPSLAGQDAAWQLGYSRMFATAYEELRLVSPMNVQTLLARLDRIIAEEQGIDYLMKRKLLVAPIAYLRALQNGDVAFSVSDDPPNAEAALAQLVAANPSANVGTDDAIFVGLYSHLQGFAAARAKEAGGVTVHEIIGELRRAIIEATIAGTKRG